MVLLDILKVVQIVISIALIAVVLLQSSGSGVGSLFGGADTSGAGRTRRGVEKTIYQMTIGLGVVFVLNALAQLLLQ
ncbi:MAG: preprotein translocase subunit SecG [Anaerolineales bacterium]